MDEDAAARHLVFLQGIGDGHLLLGDEPDIAIDTAMIGKVERYLRLAGRIGLVVAVVGFDSDDQLVADMTAQGGEIQGDGEIAAFVL